MSHRPSEPVMLLSAVALESAWACPRPTRLRQPPAAPAGGRPCSGLTASLHGAPTGFERSEAELLEILSLKPASEVPAASYYGCSPPVRSGAANPWSHDRSWKACAYSASSTNLQALRELDSEGESFLRGKDSGAARLVLGAPELPGLPAASDAGSDAATTAVNETAPFTCHTQYYLG